MHILSPARAILLGVVAVAATVLLVAVRPDNGDEVPPLNRSTETVPDETTTTQASPTGSAAGAEPEAPTETTTPPTVPTSPTTSAPAAELPESGLASSGASVADSATADTGGESLALPALALVGAAVALRTLSRRPVRILPRQ